MMVSRSRKKKTAHKAVLAAVGTGLTGAAVTVRRLHNSEFVDFSSYPISNAIIVGWMFLISTLTVLLVRRRAAGGAGRLVLWTTSILGLLQFVAVLSLSGVHDEEYFFCGIPPSYSPISSAMACEGIFSRTPGTDTEEAAVQLTLLVMISVVFAVLHGLVAASGRLWLRKP